MRLLSKSLNVISRAMRIEWRFYVHDITRLQLFSRAVEIELLQPGELLVDPNNSMAAMVTLPDGDALGVEQDQESMEGAETRGVGQCRAFENAGEDGFQARGVWCTQSRIDMANGGVERLEVGQVS